MESFICAGAAAISSICVMHPVDVVKTRLQLQGENASHSGRTYGYAKSGVLFHLESFAPLGINAIFFLQKTLLYEL